MGIRHTAAPGTNSGGTSGTTAIIQSPSSSNIATGAYSPFILNRPQGDFVYSPNANDDTISQFSRNSTTGALTALAPATVACLQTTNNAASAIAPNGSWLYVLDYTTGVVRPFSVNTGTGQLTALATVTCATGNICGIVISSDSAFLYVFSTSGSCIYQFSIAAGTGLLTPLGTPSVAVTGGESNPTNAIYLHGSGQFIYGATALGTWINRWTRNTTTGLLTAAAGTNAGVGFTAEGAGVVGNYFYVGDSIVNGRGIRYYGINTTTGVLTLNGTYADGDLSSFITPSSDGTYFFNTTSNGLFIKQYLVGASGIPVLLTSIAFAGGALPYGTVIQGSNIYTVNIPTNTIYVYDTTSTTLPAGFVPISYLTAGTLIPSLVLNYGSGAGTGTVTAGSTQILNTSAGMALNVQTGKAIALSVNGVAALTLSNILATSTVPIEWSVDSITALNSARAGIGYINNVGVLTLDYNVPTGKSHQWKANNVAIMSVNATQFQVSPAATVVFTAAAALITTTVPISWSTNVALTSSAYTIGKHTTTQLAVNSASGGSFAVRINGAAVSTWTGTLQDNAVPISWNAAVALTAGNYTIGKHGAGQVAINVPTGSNIALLVNAVAQQTFSVNGMQFNTAAGSGSAATRGIYTVAAGLHINVETGANITLAVNGTTMITATATTLTFADAFNIVINTVTGTKIGTTASQKIGFWNATPIIQPAGANQAAITDSTGGTAGFTLSDVTVTPTQTLINNNFASLNRQVDAIRTALVNAGIIKGAA